MNEGSDVNYTISISAYQQTVIEDVLAKRVGELDSSSLQTQTESIRV